MFAFIVMYQFSICAKVYNINKPFQIDPNPKQEHGANNIKHFLYTLRVSLFICRNDFFFPDPFCGCAAILVFFADFINGTFNVLYLSHDRIAINL